MDRPDLIVCPALDGYRLALVQGERFQEVASYPTMGAAIEALRKLRRVRFMPLDVAAKHSL